MNFVLYDLFEGFEPRLACYWLFKEFAWGVSFPNFGYVASEFEAGLTEVLEQEMHGLIDWRPGPDAADFQEQCHSSD
jgi:hypothetical protein